MSKRRLVAEDLLKLSLVSEVQIHPNGGFAIGCVKTVRAPGAYRSRLYRFEAGNAACALTHGDSLDIRPRWNASGSQIAFVSNRAKPASQFYSLEVSGGEAKAISELSEGSIGRYQWSPDGNQIAFLFRPKSEERSQSAIEARKKEERSDPPTIVTRWPYRLDGDGVFNDEQWALYILEVSNGVHRKVFGGQESGEIEFCWLKDSKHLALIYRAGEHRYLEPPSNELFLLDSSTGQQKFIETPPSTKLCPSLSPNGQHLAMMFHDRTAEPFGPKRTRVAVVDLQSYTFREISFCRELFLDTLITGDMRDPAEPQLLWGGNDGQIWTTASHEGSQKLAALTLDGDVEVFPIPERGEFHLCGIDTSRSKLSGWKIGTTTATEACFIDVTGTPKCELASELNRWFADEIELLEPEEHWLTSPNGESFQSWVLQPEARTGRAAIEVHGGPAAMYSCACMFEMQLLAAHGFTVFYSNPHGSAGYSEAFVRSILGNWGELDWQDIQTLTNFAKEFPGVDSSKICILGGSYGGFMVNWAISHSQNYCRAITDRCVSNLMSKWGNSDYMFVPDGNWPGAVFGDYSVLLECSPIKHFANVKTPTLIIHSEGDLRCPIEQGEQVYTALKILGIETRFVRYPLSTSHGLSRNGPPDLRVHRLREIVDWLLH